MNPIKPDIPDMIGWKHVIYAEDQAPYLPLPAFKELDRYGNIITCWELSLKERIKIFLLGRFYIRVMTFNEPLQPIVCSIDKPVFVFPADAPH